MAQTYTPLLELKTWLNSVVADDLHRVILEGTTLKMVSANKPDLIISEFVVPTIEAPVVEEAAPAKTDQEAPLAAKRR